MRSPRLLSVDAIRKIKFDGAYANLITSEILNRENFSSQDAAFFTDLVNGTVRYLRFLDYIISKCANRSHEEIESDLLIILEISAYSALIRQTKAHAVVNEAVELARKVVGERSVGFVNAVLRKVVAKTRSEWNRDIQDHLDHNQALATIYSIPDWIYQTTFEQMPNEADRLSFLRVLNAPPEVTVLRPPFNEHMLAASRPGYWSPFALRPGTRGNLSSLLNQHGFIVQDEGSQLVALATTLIPVSGPDLKWLDMTAGPGGKAAFLASVAKSRGAHLTANELHEHRAKLIEHTFNRLDLPGKITTTDALVAPWKNEFDRVLLDAPCTGLGALRRRAESRWRKTPEDLIQLVDLQKKLLAKAIAATRPGGIVAYTTCSLHPRETEEVVEVVMKTTNSELIDLGKLLPSVPLTSAPFIKLWPHIHGTDGMFMAALRVG